MRNNDPNPNRQPGATHSFSTLFFAGVILMAIYVGMGVHIVPEGHVGAYWVGGALKNVTTHPGYHFDTAWPISKRVAVQVTMQTDSVMDIPCGTSGGVVLNFDKIEVVNRLDESAVYPTLRNYTEHYDRIWIFDKIHHEINQFCSKHSVEEVYITQFDTLDESLAEALQKDCDKYCPGLDIIAVRVTKPRIPHQLRENYEAMESEKTKLLIAKEAQKVEQNKAETEKMKATIQAEMKSAVSAIANQERIDREEAATKIDKLKSEAAAHRKRIAADADSYSLEKEALGYQKLLTPEYLQWQLIKAIGNNTKLFFGESIPKMYTELGGQLPEAIKTVVSAANVEASSNESTSPTE